MPSGRMPSPRSPSSAATKSARRKRERDGACAANSLQRSSEAGSRSTAISSPSGADALGDQAGVAAAAEGAVDEGLAGLGVEDVDQLGRQYGFVFLRHI